MANNSELNKKLWGVKTEIVFSRKRYSNNLFYLQIWTFFLVWLENGKCSMHTYVKSERKFNCVAGNYLTKILINQSIAMSENVEI